MRSLSLAQVFLAVVVVMCISPRARAQALEACSDAYARGQEERLAGRLYNARAAFQQCAADPCAALASDCTRWVKEVEADLPTLRLSVRDERGAAVLGASVSIDGSTVSPSGLAAPIVLEAGPHELRIEAPGYESVRLEKALRPSDREVPVIVILRPPPAPVARVASRQVPTASWVLAGVGTLALGGSVYFGVRARSEYQDLKQSCAPTCEPSASEAMHTKAVIADVALAGAVVALAASAIVYFTRSRPAPASAWLVGLQPRPGSVELAF